MQNVIITEEEIEKIEIIEEEISFSLLLIAYKTRVEKINAGLFFVDFLNLALNTIL